MATSLEIANGAMLRLGAEPIGALTDDNERTRAFNTGWPFVRESVLREHSWNAATVRVLLKSYAPDPLFDFAKAYTLPADCLRVLETDSVFDWRVEGRRVVTDGSHGGTVSSTTVTISGNPTAADPVVVPVSGHSFVVGDVVRIAGAAMTELNGRNFYVSAISAGVSITLQDEDGTGRTTGSGGTAAEVTKGDLGVRYIKDFDTDAELADADAELTHAFVLRTAIELVERITDSTTKRQTLLAEYDELVRSARRTDGEEQSPAEFEEDDWILARY